VHALALSRKIEKAIFSALIHFAAEQLIVVHVHASHGVSRRATVHAEALCPGIHYLGRWLGKSKFAASVRATYNQE